MILCYTLRRRACRPARKRAPRGISALTVASQPGLTARWLLRNFDSLDANGLQNCLRWAEKQHVVATQLTLSGGMKEFLHRLRM